jgi:hypothetical protein
MKELYAGNANTNAVGSELRSPSVNAMKTVLDDVKNENFIKYKIIKELCDEMCSITEICSLRSCSRIRGFDFSMRRVQRTTVSSGNDGSDGALKKTAASVVKWLVCLPLDPRVACSNPVKAIDF